MSQLLLFQDKKQICDFFNPSVLDKCKRKELKLVRQSKQPSNINSNNTR